MRTIGGGGGGGGDFSRLIRVCWRRTTNCNRRRLHCAKLAIECPSLSKACRLQHHGWGEMGASTRSVAPLLSQLLHPPPRQPCNPERRTPKPTTLTMLQLPWMVAVVFAPAVAAVVALTNMAMNARAMKAQVMRPR